MRRLPRVFYTHDHVNLLQYTQLTFLQLLNRFKQHLWVLHNLGRESINLGSLKVTTIPRFSTPDFSKFPPSSFFTFAISKGAYNNYLPLNYLLCIYGAFYEQKIT